MNKFIELNKAFKSNKSNAILITMVLIGLFVFSYSIDNVSAAPTTIYVNASGGSDTYDGTSAVHTTGNVGPVADISTGITNVNAGGTVQVASGLYTGTKDYGITITKDVNINGQSKSTTTIVASNNLWIFYNPGFKVSISNLTMNQGKCTTGGGAIGNAGGSMSVTNCNFNKNSAITGNGGAIANSNSASLTVTNSNFNGNTAAGGGGAIYNSGTVPVTITGCTFTGNTATGNGGAINNDIGQTMTVTGCTFTDNTATGNGGAIDNVNTLTVSSSTFTDNTAIANGGAIGTNGLLNVDNSIFTGNYAIFGGAIINFKTFNVTHCTFTSNIATSGGGAIYNNANLINTVTGCTLNDNTASNGGAVYNSGTLNVTSSTLVDNAASAGGAVYNSGTLNVTSSTLTGNTAVSGGAIDNVGTINFQINRVVGNSAFTGSSINSFGTNVNISNNWWGSNYGPEVGIVVGTTVPSWLVLNLSGNPSTIGNNGHSTLTANLNYNNLGNYVSFLANRIPVIFTTTMGTVSPSTTVNGVAKSTLTSGVPAGVATVHAYLDYQALQTTVTIKDTIAPKVKSTNPVNGQKGFSKTGTLAIKFSENIRASKYYNSIKVKNMKTGKYVTISKSISGYTLNIKTSGTRTGNVWYEIIIPKAAIRDNAGNNLAANYVCKFQTKK